MNLTPREQQNECDQGRSRASLIPFLMFALLTALFLSCTTAHASQQVDQPKDLQPRSSLLGQKRSVSLYVIGEIESGQNPYAYNKKSRAIGLYQITPICLLDFNQQNKTNITSDQLYDANYNTLVASWYFENRIPSLLKHYKLPLTLDNIIWAYNAGIKSVIKGKMPLETYNYINKYKRLTKGE